MISIHHFILRVEASERIEDRSKVGRRYGWTFVVYLKDNVIGVNVRLHGNGGVF